MKTTFKTLLCALCTIAVFSCQKKEADSPVDQASQAGYSKITLSAVSDQTKTTLDGNVIKWAENDALKVYCSDDSAQDFTLVDGVGSSSGTFSGLVPEGANALYAVYPAASYSSVSGTTVKVTVPSEQNGVFGAGNIAVAQVDASTKNMPFKNVNAFIGFTVPADITKVIVSSVDGSNLSGTVSVDCSGSSPVADGVESGASSITTTFPSSEGGTYYVSIAPGVAHAKGLKFEYYKEAAVSGTYYLNKNITAAATAAGSVLDMGEVETGGNYYVTVSGAGNQNGMSWANAMSAEKMWKKLTLAGTDPDTDAAKVAAINGATFHLGKGNYEMPSPYKIEFNESETVSLTFKGDYPAEGGARTDYENRANFTGNNSHAAMIIRGKVNVTFERIGFINGYTENDEDGSGISAALDCYKVGTIALKNCYVKDNTHASNGNFGAGIRITGSEYFSADSVTFARNTSPGAAALSTRDTRSRLESCAFIDNTATASDAGAIYVAGTKGTEIKKSSFENNSSARWGGAICYNRSTNNNLTLWDCTFTGCHSVGGKADSSSPNMGGGAIGTRTGSLGTLEIRGCTFDGCYSSGNGGAVMTQCNGELKINTSNETKAKSLFQNCYASGSNMGGAVTITNGTMNMTVEQASFVGNHAYGGGAICQNNNSSTIYLSECSFDANYSTRWGCVYYASRAKDFYMYNCSVRGSYNTDISDSDVNVSRLAWFYFEVVAGKASIANSSIIGDPRRKESDGTYTTNFSKPLALVCTDSANLKLTNNIIVPETNASYIYSIAGDAGNRAVDIYYNHYGKLTWVTGTPEGGSSDCLSSSIGGLAWEDGCWTWNGNIAGAAPTLATRDDIYNRINGFSSAFTDWVYFNYDQRHIGRGTGSWWPGAYQPAS